MLTIGRIFNGFVTIEPSETVQIKPPTKTEAVVQNIYVSGMASLYVTDDTNEILIDSITSDYGAWIDFKFHVTPTYYLIVKSLEVNKSINVAWDGVITFEED